MKKILFLFLLCTTVCNAQKENNIWYFGKYAALDFNGGSPVPINGSEMWMGEGSASIADENGDLLFYTDGRNVWNKNNVLMPDGTGLHGHASATHAAVIMKKPGSLNVYYIFTNHGIYDPTTSYGVQYSEVDMALDGGYGNVTVKNIPIIGPTTEKLAVTLINDSDFWLVTHGLDNNAYYAYKVTDAGISPPVITNIGQVTNYDSGNYLGQFKISPTGDKLAAANGATGIELYDFDISTGSLGNLQELYTGEENYGLEFSASGKMLYTTDIGRKLLQFDLTASDVASSMFYVYNMPSDEYPFICGLQLAPDGKIYITSTYTEKLSVINNPEILGIGCDMQISTVDLGSGLPTFGFPTLCATTLFKEYITPIGNIPKGISPNGDLKNDMFDLSAFGVKQLVIFNRYGIEVFSQANYSDEWHGQDSHGNTLPDGTYYYCIRTSEAEKTGWVYVIRKSN